MSYYNNNDQAYQSYNDQTQYDVPQETFNIQQGNNDYYYPNQGQAKEQKDYYINKNHKKIPKTVNKLEFDARKGFIRKITTGLIFLALYTSFGDWFCQVYYQPFGSSYLVIQPFWWVCLVVSLVLQIALFCFGNNAKKVPTNYILLFLYIVFFASMIAGLCVLMSDYVLIYNGNNNGPILVWYAWGLTFIIVFFLTFYACLTKNDMEYSGLLFFIWIPIMVCIVMCVAATTYETYIISFYILTTLIIILYGFYLIFETKLIMNVLSYDDYVIGSLMLYGTIIQLFIRILELIIISRKK